MRVGSVLPGALVRGQRPGLAPPVTRAPLFLVVGVHHESSSDHSRAAGNHRPGLCRLHDLLRKQKGPTIARRGPGGWLQGSRPTNDNLLDDSRRIRGGDHKKQSSPGRLLLAGAASQRTLLGSFLRGRRTLTLTREGSVRQAAAAFSRWSSQPPNQDAADQAEHGEYDPGAFPEHAYSRCCRRSTVCHWPGGFSFDLG
jgi:hypothetical protein